MQSFWVITHHDGRACQSLAGTVSLYPDRTQAEVACSRLNAMTPDGPRFQVRECVAVLCGSPLVL